MDSSVRAGCPRMETTARGRCVLEDEEIDALLWPLAICDRREEWAYTDRPCLRRRRCTKCPVEDECSTKRVDWPSFSETNLEQRREARIKRRRCSFDRYNDRWPIETLAPDKIVGSTIATIRIASNGTDHIQFCFAVNDEHCFDDEAQETRAWIRHYGGKNDDDDRSASIDSHAAIGAALSKSRPTTHGCRRGNAMNHSKKQRCWSR